VEYRIHRDVTLAVLHPREDRPLLQRYPELLIGLEQLRIDLIERPRPGLLLRRGVVVDILVVDRRVMHLGPVRLFHYLPGRERLQPPSEQPFRLAFARGDKADRVLAKPFRGYVHLDIGLEAPLVTGLG